MIGGKQLGISEYKQLLKARKLAGYSVTGRHQLWREATAAKAAMAASRPGSGGQYHDDGSVNGTANVPAAAAAVGPLPFPSHHCSAYGNLLIIVIVKQWRLFV